MHRRGEGRRGRRRCRNREARERSRRMYERTLREGLNPFLAKQVIWRCGRKELNDSRESLSSEGALTSPPGKPSTSCTVTAPPKGTEGQGDATVGNPDDASAENLDDAPAENPDDTPAENPDDAPAKNP